MLFILHVLLRAKHLQLNSNTLSYYPCIVAVAAAEKDNPADEEAGVNTNTTPLNILILSAA